MLDNLNGEIEFREEILRDIDLSQKNLGQARDLIAEELSQLCSMRNIFKSEDVYPREYNSIFEGSIDTMIDLSASDMQNAERLASAVSSIRTNTESFLKYTMVSGSTFVPSMATTAVYLAECMENREEIQPFVEAIKRPSSRDRRVELSSKLSEIDPRLSRKLEGAWQTLQDRSKKDRFRQAAHSARELISDLLCLLAPDDQVKTMEWFVPETKNRKPSQRQRARFAMLGRNDALTEADIQPIHELANDIRKAYEKLNKLAHIRKYEADLQRQTESLIDLCQIYLLKLLEMRKAYFKS